MSERPAPSTRDAYKHWQDFPTRWMDNDVYGHINNATYYSYIDTIVNDYLIANGLDINDGQVIALAAETGCRYHAELAYPEVIEAGLRVGQLGRSSVRYDVGLFSHGRDTASAEGYFVHVFVGRLDHRPIEIPPQIRDALQALA